MKRHIKYGLLAIMLLFIVASLGAIKVQAATTIHNGIYVDGIDMSGKTVSEANSLIEERVSQKKDAVVTLSSPTGYKINVHPGEIGMKWNNPDVIDEAAAYGISGNVVARFKQSKDLERDHVEYKLDISYNREKVTGLLENYIDDISREPQDYQVNRDGGEFIIKEGQSGVSVDIEASASAIISYLKNGWNGKDVTIELIAEVEEAQGSNTDLAAITDIIGSYTTSYKTSTASRCKNVENGCSKLTGMMVYPGETFSVLDHVVPFTKDNGYELAGSYMNGLVVDTYGGGICQVTSTLYNALLLAELKIDERHNHSMLVDYTSPSGDAAIAESSGKDLKFTNNKEYPIYIEGITTEDKLITFNIYGIEDRPENREILFKSEVLERNVPETENIVQDGSKPVGYLSLTAAHTGIKAKYIKEVRVDGILESSEDINKSTYKMVPRTLVVGVGTDNPDIANQLQAAIATGSIDQVRATAKALAAQAANPAPVEEPQAGDP